MTFDPVALATAFGLIFLAELPDKTMFASLAMGTRMRPLYVWFGTSSAFVLHVAIAVGAGSLIGLLPNMAVKLVAAALFAFGAFMLLRAGDDADDADGADAAGGADAADAADAADGAGGADAADDGHSAGGVHGGEGENGGSTGKGGKGGKGAGRSVTGFWPVYGTAFMAVFISEWGDLTQITTANLASTNGLVPTAIGAVAALMSVSALALLVGRFIAHRVPLKTVQRIGGACMAGLAVWSVVEAFTG